ncbi:MAG TPA: hypothetical protein VEJ84_21545 [Acidimicrobiales bacterium]|nr:hypothetical protein [Acidimicrobiales bacterium]
MAGSDLIPFLVLMVELAIAVLIVVGWARILRKAGYSPWWLLVGFVPVLNVIMFLVFAFSPWPALQNRASYNGGGPLGPYGGGQYPYYGGGRGPEAGMGQTTTPSWDPAAQGPQSRSW